MDRVDEELAVASGRTSVEPVAEILPPAPQASRVWLLIGSGLVWAARELLPEVLDAWQASRVGALQPASCKSVVLAQVASQWSRGARHHRWGRA